MSDNTTVSAPAQDPAPGCIQDLYELCRKARDRYAGKDMPGEARLFQARLETLERDYPGLVSQDESAREIRRLNALLDRHPRSRNLLEKGKTFIVIAVDEPYFPEVYEKIYQHEMLKGRWTAEDQEYMDLALLEWSGYQFAGAFDRVDSGAGQGTS